MEVVFCGVGEAFDEELTNTSLLVLAGDGERKSQILLDCGFSAAHPFWRLSPDPLNLDAVWISHFHGDHFFGLPLVLLRFWEEGRKKPLTIVGQEGVQDMVNQAMDLAYANFRNRMHYPIRFVTAEPGKDVEVAGCRWSFAENDHSAPSYSVRIDSEETSVFYSGDGRPTPGTLALATGCDLVVHEAYRVGGDTPGHGSVSSCIEFGQAAGAATLALVHMNRDDRKKKKEEIKTIISRVSTPFVLVPEPGERCSVGRTGGKCHLQD